MGRRSKLTEQQWAKIQKRLAGGESASALAREFGVSRSVISEKFSGRVGKIKDAVNQYIAAEESINSLTIPEQITVRTLIDELKAVNHHLGGAAKFNAMTAHSMSRNAYELNGKINTADLLDTESDSVQAVKSINALVDVSNKASQIGINLLNANKEQIAKTNAGKELPSISVSFKESTRMLDSADAG